MKKLEKLAKVKKITKREQQAIKGGEVPMSCADMGLEHMPYERCIRVAPPNCRDWCNR